MPVYCIFAYDIYWYLIFIAAQIIISTIILFIVEKNRIFWKIFKKGIDKRDVMWYTNTRPEQKATLEGNTNIAASPSGKATDSDSVIT